MTKYQQIFNLYSRDKVFETFRVEGLNHKSKAGLQLHSKFGPRAGRVKESAQWSGVLRTDEYSIGAAGGKFQGRNPRIIPPLVARIGDDIQLHTIKRHAGILWWSCAGAPPWPMHFHAHGSSAVTALRSSSHCAR